jgi:leucine dehydrogenase
MSYKNAMAGLALGGGKAVIIDAQGTGHDDGLYERFGEFVDSLNGDYITAEDVGMSPAIMQVIATRTRYVTGLPAEGGRAGGDPSPKTALGIFTGIEAAVRHALDRDGVAGLKVAVQGAGNVGYHLCRLLAAAGAKLVVADIDAAKVERIRSEFGAEVASADDILFREVDIVSPCALGAVLDAGSIPRIRARIVAGGANNQLEHPDDGRRLAEAGILYAPDYVINAGGIINVACEYEGDATDREVDERVREIGPRLQQIFEQAQAEGRPTNEIADSLARARIAAGAAAS